MYAFTAGGGMSPQRIQLRRTKGWRKPEGAVVVARPGKWGNPWAVSRDVKRGRWVVKADFQASSEIFLTREEAVASAVRWFRSWAWRLDAAPLRGRDLACWCPLDQPCHADVLLEIANPDRSLPLPSDPMANVLDDCRICQGTGMATLNPDEEPGSHTCVPAEDGTCTPVRKAMEASS